MLSRSLRDAVATMFAEPKKELSEPVKLMPITPTPRQREFLSLDCQEALYGGAAGGGKSEALLMWLAEGINIPGYSGLIFRRTFPQLSRSNDGLIAKSMKLYKPLGGEWHGTEKQWKFPSGAIIEMGHLPYAKSIYDYQGASYHRIAFDELTQFTEDQYQYLFSRIRKIVGFPITLGMRAGSNPGGEGHLWVKARFVTQESMDLLRSLGKDDHTPPGSVFYSTEDRAFVPSRLIDNPFIDAADYERQLMHLPPVTRARLMAGDWSISENGEFKADWLRYWEPQGDYYRLFSQAGKLLKVVHPNECTRLVTIDAASTSDAKAKEKRGGRANFTVASVFDYYPPSGLLIWRDMRRGRWGFPEQCQQVRSAFKDHDPAWIGAENASNGRPLLDTLTDLPMKPLEHGGKDKLARAARWLNDASEGKFYLPRFASWLDDAEGEILTWTGLPDEQDDIIDTCAYAALYSRSAGGGAIEMDGVMLGGR